jgi:hypothetical protein
MLQKRQKLDVLIREFAIHLFAERTKTVMHRLDDGFIRAALLDLLVNAVFDENSHERFVVQFLFELLLFEVELALEVLDQLRGILPQHFRHRHLDGPVVPDHDDAAVDRRLAIGECIQRIHQFFSADSLRRFDLDLHVFRREVIDAADLQFALPHGVFNRREQRLGRGRWRNLLDDDCRFVLDLDLRAHLDAPFAVGVLARVHQPARLEIGQAFK